MAGGQKGANLGGGFHGGYSGDLFRGDFRGPQVLGLLSVSQTIGGIMAGSAVAFLIFGPYRESGDAMENRGQRKSGSRRRKHI